MEKSAVIEEMNINENSTGKQPPKKRKTLKIAMLIGGGIVVSAVAFLLWAVVLYGNIYSGVVARGIDLGGMSKKKAAELIRSESDKLYSNTSFTLTVDDHTEIFTSKELNISLPIDEIVNKAHAQGRTGNFGERLGFVLGCLFNKTEIDVTDDIILDKAALDARLEQFSRQINIEPKEYSYTITNKSIDIQIAQEGKILPVDALSAVIYDKIYNADFAELEYQTSPIPFQELDLVSLYAMVYVEPKDSFLQSTEDGVQIMPHSEGLYFDMDQAVQLISSGQSEVSIPLIKTTPEVTQQVLADSLFKDVLGEYTTKLINSPKNRTNNIRTAATYANGTIILPGEEFSYNKAVGERTIARGFSMAGIFLNGQVLDEVGGGICQLASTMYNAALNANMKIVERRNHSLLVSYTPIGLDATVSWGSIDFRFLNDTGYPIQMLTSVEGSNVIVTLMGTKTNDYTVTMERTAERYTPFSTIQKENPALAPGASVVVADGHTGAYAEVYRVVKDSAGNIISRTFESKSTYNKTDKIIEVGPRVPEETPPVTPVSPPPETPPAEPTAPPAEPVENFDGEI